MSVPFEINRYAVLGPVEEFREMRNSFQSSAKANSNAEEFQACTERSGSCGSNVDEHLSGLPEDLRQAARQVVDQLPSFAIARKIAECYRNAYKQLAQKREWIAEEIEEANKMKMKTMKRANTREKHLMLHESLQEERQYKAMLSWQQAAGTWVQTAEQLSQRLASRVESLAMESGREFNARQRDISLFSLATSNDDRFGDDLWGTSLRENWTRYVPVGSVLNGLYCQVKPTSYQNFHTIIRNDDSKQSDWQTRGRSWSGNKLVEKQNLRARKKLKEHGTDFADESFMAVTGEALKSELEKAYQQKVTIADIEEQIQRSNPEIYSKLMEAKNSFEDLRNSMLPDTSKSSHDEIACSGPMVALKDENNNCVWSTKLSILATPNATATARTQIHNLGATAIYYEWIRMPFEIDGIKGKSQEQHTAEKIQILQPKGVLLPGESRIVTVLFFSATNGTFLSTFRLRTEPSVHFEAYNGPLTIPKDTEWKSEIKVVATVSSQDNNSMKRKQITKDIDELVKNSSIDEAIRVIYDRMRPSDMPVSKTAYDPFWLTAEVEFNIQNFSFSPPIFFSTDVAYELLQLAKTIGLSYEKRFSFEEIERKCMHKEEKGDEASADLPEPAQDVDDGKPEVHGGKLKSSDDQKASEATKVKEANVKSKGKPQAASKNAKGDSESAKKGSAQSKTLARTEKGSNASEAKDNSATSNADKTAKDAKQKGKSEPAKATGVRENDEEPEQSTADEKSATNSELPLDCSVFLPRLAVLRELSYQPRTFDTAVRRAILESVYTFANIIAKASEPLVEARDKLKGLQRSLVEMGGEERDPYDEHGTETNDLQGVAHGSVYANERWATSEELPAGWPEDGESSPDALSVILDKISKAKIEMEEMRASCLGEAILEARTAFLGLDSSLLACLQNALAVYDNPAPLEPPEPETETSVWKEFFRQRARAGIQECINCVQKTV